MSYLQQLMVRTGKKSWRGRDASIILLSGLLFVYQGLAQTTKPPSIGSKEKRDAAERERTLRSNAITTLDSVIDELPQLDRLQDQLLVAEGIVKQLGRLKPDRCRKLLDSLFERANEARKKTSEESRGSDPHPDELVERIVELAASFDVKLAESYAERYSSGDTDSASARPVDPDAARNAALRLRLALQLVDKEPAVSVSVAQNSLNAGVFPETLTFLGVLRKKNIKLANRFFSDALVSVQRRGGADVNELFLLYSYVFSPRRVPVATTRGIGVLSIPEYYAIAQEYAVEPVLAQLYLATSTRTILDQNRLAPNAVPLLRNGIEGDYYFISVIQPLVMSSLSSAADAIAMRRSVLLGMLQQNGRGFSGDAVERWNKSPPDATLTGTPNGQAVDILMERAEKTDDVSRRDRLYYQAATRAVTAKEYERALKIVDKLSGPASEEAKRFIIFDVALHAGRNDEIDLAEFYARRDDDLTRRAFLLTTIAASLAEGRNADPLRARQFLLEASELALKINKEDERATVLFGLVAVYAGLDSAIASDRLTIAIESANKVAEFGRDGGINRGLRIGGFLFDYSLYGDQFTFTLAIRKMADRDFEQTVSQIRVFKDRLPRLRATVTSCDAVLSRLSSR